MESLRVLQIRSEFDDNGCATMALQIGRELARRGHEPLFASSGGVFADRMVKEGMKHFDLPTLHVQRRDWASTRETVRELAEIIRDENVSVIHSHNAAATGCAWLALRRVPKGRRIPILQSVHGLELRRTHFWRNWIYPLVPVTYLPVSQFTSTWLGQLGVPASRRPVVYNGVDRTVFRPDVPAGVFREEIGAGSDALLVGTVGQVNTWKHQEGLIRIAPRILAALPGRDVRFIFVGKGPRVEFCRDLSRELGIADKVHLLGFRDDILPIIADLDLVVQPSVRGEMLPVALIEAMAMGKPWVGSALSGIPELAATGAGTTVPAGDPAALEAAIVELLRDPSRRKVMSDAALRAVETTFDIRVIVNRILEQYDLRRRA